MFEIKTALTFCLDIKMHVVEMLIDLEFHLETMFHITELVGLTHITTH